MKTLKISVLLLAAMSMVQCTNEVENDLQPESNVMQQEIPREVLSNLENMGFDIHQAPIISEKNGYIVEGDILILNEVIEQFINQKQAYLRIIDCANATDVRIQNNLGDNEAGRGVQRAIDLWNNVSDSSLKLVLVDSNPDINIRLARGNEIGRNYAIGKFPLNRKAGDLIRINLEATTPDGTALTERQWANAIAHEIGHNIGLMHTNQELYGTGISGTPDGGDAESIMTPGESIETINFVLNTNGLSENDELAVSTMYNNSGTALCR